MVRKHEHLQLLEVGIRANRANHVRARARLQLHVEDDDVRPELAQGLEDVFLRFRLAHDFDPPGLRDELAQHFGDGRGIVGEEDRERAFRDMGGAVVLLWAHPPYSMRRQPTL
jgi:hypothetical protein